MKGRSTDYVSKTYCHGVNYGLLSLLYPNEYPVVMVEQEDVSGYASRSGDCSGLIQLKSRYHTMHSAITVPVHCDCSDPENYKFKDEGKF